MDAALTWLGARVVGKASAERRGVDLARGFIHTVHRNGRWINEVEGEGAIPGTFRTKAEAVASGRRRARRDKTEYVIHKLNGQIGDRYSYGHATDTIRGRERGASRRQERWRAYLTDDEPPELAFYCEICAEREFRSE